MLEIDVPDVIASSKKVRDNAAHSNIKSYIRSIDVADIPNLR